MAICLTRAGVQGTVVAFIEVTRRTIENYLEQYFRELSHNGYGVLNGN